MENIAFGDLRGLSNQVRVWQAGLHAGAMEPIERAPEGIETLLGKWLGGAELRQGIALARVFFRQASLVILVEPTSSMDSWTEHDWLDRFRHAADIILALDRRQVVESNTYAELVSMGVAHASSWAAQMREIGRG